MAGPWEKYRKPAAPTPGPWEKYRPAATPAEPEVEGGAPQAALEGAGQSITLGYLPQLQAKAQPVVDRVMNAGIGVANKLGLTDLQELPADKLAPIEQLTENGADYISARDKNISRQQEQAKIHPVATMGGQAAGIVTTSLIPGKFIAQGVKGAGGVASVLKGVATGAAEAAVLNPGDKQGEYNPMQVAERLDNAKYGAAFGGVGAGAAKTISAGVSGAKKLAEGLAFKSSGAMLKDFRAASSRGKVQDLGRFMLDRVIKAGDTVDDIAAKSEQLKNEAGQEIGRIYKSVLEEAGDPTTWVKVPPAQKSALAMTGFKPAAQKAEIVSSIEKTLGDSPNKKAAMAFINEYLDDLGAKYGNDLDVVASNKIKGDIDKAINYSKRAQDLPEKQEALLVLRNHIRDQIESHIDALDNILGSSKVKELRAANKVFGAASEIENIAFDRMQRESANNLFSLNDRIFGAATTAGGAVTGAALGGDAESAAKGAAIGLVGMAGSRAARRIGTAGAAKALDAVAKRPGMAGAPAAVASIASKVANEPKYEKSSAPAPTDMIAKESAPISAGAVQPLKGEAKWAAEGARKLGESAELKGVDLKDPKLRRLLIQASDLKPGSPAMKRVIEQIREKSTKK